MLSRTTLVDKSVREALKLKNLRLPPTPRVLALEAEDDCDMDGKDALRVYVIVPDGTEFEEVEGESVLEIRRVIHDSLLSHGVRLWPFLFYRTESDRREELAREEE